VPVAVRNDALAAIAVVRDESPIRSMGDLSGATVAMAPEFAATTYLAKVMLIRAGLAPRKDLAIKYFEDHHSCIHQAVIGTAALCFTGIQAARLYEVTTGRKLRVIARSPSIPQSLFVVHSRVSPKDRETVRETLLHTTLQGLAPELSEYLSRDPQKPFIPVQDADYDVVRQYWRMVEEGR
jgi:ABC-type phosphate/phosphonate transport system substrate-binding protein